MQLESVIKILPKQIRQYLLNQKVELHNIQEMKLRAGKPLIIVNNTGEVIVRKTPREIYMVTESDLRETMNYISNYSLYAYEEEMKQGFITIEGGHRVGLCGKAIVENGQIKNLKYISSINIRICHEIAGCADKVIPYIINDNNLYHILIISPPRCGKTTLLRDIIRQISDGNEYIHGCTVGVVDERSEIGGCYRGVPQNQLGIRTDILDACPKVEGMMMLIRSMGPEVIAVDEIGTPEDVHAVEYAMHCGCKMLATVHGKSLDEIKEKPVLGNLVKEHRFERYVVLGNKRGAGSVEGIYDENGRSINNSGDNEFMGDKRSFKSKESTKTHEILTENNLPDAK